MAAAILGPDLFNCLGEPCFCELCAGKLDERTADDDDDDEKDEEEDEEEDEGASGEASTEERKACSPLPLPLPLPLLSSAVASEGSHDDKGRLA
jgi:hypothetical protein